MKKIFYTLLFMLYPFTCMSEEVSYNEEVRSLGLIAGQGLACDARRYHTFELLARAFLITKAKSDDMQAEGMQIYNGAKADAFISKVKDGFDDCRSIADSFDKQKIFKMVLYGDGTLKMPDGEVISPRHAYDATLVYRKDPEARQKALENYKKLHSEILNDPAYKKALRERQQQVGM